MADIRINALATTAASTASDDFIAVDGSANGTRKLNAYSPTFGGNLTVSGTGTQTFSGQIYTSKTGASGGSPAAMGLFVGTSLSDGIGIGDNGSSAYKIIQSYSGALSVNPAGNNLLVGTTTDGGQKLQVVGQSSTGFISATDYSNGDAGQFIARGARGTAASPLAQNASDSTGLVRMYGYDGSSFIENARIYAQTAGTIATNRVGGVLSFWTHPDSTSAIAEAMRITQSQNLLLGTTTDGGQKLQVNGTGSIKDSILVASSTDSTNYYFKASANYNYGKAFSLEVRGGGASLGDIFTWADSAGLTLNSLTGSNLTLKTSNATALTLASDQSATFAGKITQGGSSLSSIASTNVSTTATDIAIATSVGGMYFVTGYNTSGGAQGTWLLIARGTTVTTVSSDNNTGLTVTFSMSSGKLQAATASGTIALICTAITR